MRNLLLSVALIASPVLVFAAGYTMVSPPSVAQLSQAQVVTVFGDMTPFASITTDVQAIASTGDLSAAENRITDLETVWDEAQASLRPVNPAYWGNVDGAIDDALRALRANTPDPANVDTTLAALQVALADPSLGGAANDATGTVMTVAGVPTTDASGRPLPCEVMLDTFRTTLTGATLTDADRAAVEALQAKGTERCNADDDQRADDFFAQGIALMSR